jgi:hypothetical protein
VEPPLEPACEAQGGWPVVVEPQPSGGGAQGGSKVRLLQGRGPELVDHAAYPTPAIARLDAEWRAYAAQTAAKVAGSLSAAADVVTIFVLFVLVLLFPDGRLPSRRWRPAAWFVNSPPCPRAGARLDGCCRFTLFSTMPSTIPVPVWMFAVFLHAGHRNLPGGDPGPLPGYR